MSGSEPWKTLGRTYEESLAIFKDPAKETYIALADGLPAGFLVLIMKGAFVGYIQSIGVRPEWRGQGLGTRLLRFAEKRIFAETPNVFLCVSSFNANARRLYERLGYRVVGELEDYIIPGHSEFLMRKTTGPLSRFKRSKTREET